MNKYENKEYNNKGENNEYNSINDKEFNINNNNYINSNSKSISSNFNYNNDNRKNNEDIINNKNIDITNNNNDNIAFDRNKDININSYAINGQNKNNIKNDDLIFNENKNVDSEETTKPMSTNNEIVKIKDKIKEKKDDIVDQTNTINQITQKNKIVNENYKKALLLSLNLGFLLPKKIYSLYISSPYLYNNIKKEVLLRVALKKLENDYIKLNYFILEHVSYINF